MSFDLKVHHVNPKTMRVEREDAYRLHIDKEHGRRFERPPGSGCFFDEAGTLLDSPEMRAKAKAKAESDAKDLAALSSQLKTPQNDAGKASLGAAPGKA